MTTAVSAILDSLASNLPATRKLSRRLRIANAAWKGFVLSQQLLTGSHKIEHLALIFMVYEHLVHALISDPVLSRRILTAFEIQLIQSAGMKMEAGQ